MHIEYPIFVLAPPRSFTSLFCGVLGQHPELYGMPELNLFQSEEMREFWLGPSHAPKMTQFLWRLWGRQGVLRAVAQLYAGEQTIDAIEMAERWGRVRLSRSTSEVFRELCRKASPLRVLDKSPIYTSRKPYLDRIIRAFPKARFIHFVRHPRGQCESFMQIPEFRFLAFHQNAIDRRPVTPVVDPQVLWHDAHVRIFNFLEGVPRDQWVRIRGEAFMADTEGVLGGLCRWLGLSTSESAMRSMKHPEDSPFACMGPPNAPRGNDPNYLKKPELRPYRAKEQSLEGALGWRPDGEGFHPRVIDLARKLGYT